MINFDVTSGTVVVAFKFLTWCLIIYPAENNELTELFKAGLR